MEFCDYAISEDSLNLIDKSGNISTVEKICKSINQWKYNRFKSEFDNNPLSGFSMRVTLQDHRRRIRRSAIEFASKDKMYEAPGGRGND